MKKKKEDEMKKDLLSIRDLTREEFMEIIERGIERKRALKEGREDKPLKGKVLAMIFEKPSLRTRVTFEVGMYQLGGYAVYLAPQDIKLGVRESVPDVARNLSRWVDGIMARVFSHDTVVGLAENASVPVINGLCDLEHPCQILADFMTIYEHKKRFEGLTLAWVGDGNNVCHSLLLASGLMGVNMRVATPEGYEPKEEIVKVAKEYAERSGAEIEILHSPQDAVKDADIIYTDVWASMGQESEAEKRKRIFMNYQVNPELVKLAKPDYIFMHCLPAHRGEEVTDEVLDGPNSVVLDEAENRLHAQKALLVKLMSR